MQLDCKARKETGVNPVHQASREPEEIQGSRESRVCLGIQGLQASGGSLDLQEPQVHQDRMDSQEEGESRASLGGKEIQAPQEQMAGLEIQVFGFNANFDQFVQCLMKDDILFKKLTVYHKSYFDWQLTEYFCVHYV